MRRLLFIMLLFISWSSVSLAETTLPKRSVLTQQLALSAVQAALVQCEKEGYAVSAAAVDSAGVVLAQLRDYHAGPHTIDSSTRKAYTSASLREPTQKLALLLAKTPQIQALRDMNEHILILGGGIPIKIADEIVGAIGVGGAPGAHLDENCARAGLRAISADEYK